MRNPYHADALTADELTVGRTVSFHYGEGKSFDITIVKGPHMATILAYGKPEKRLSVIISHLNSSGTLYVLSEVGVVPYDDGHWDDNRYITAL